MGKIVSSYIFPHPPIIIPEVGKGHESGALETIEAVKKAAFDIKSDAPGTIILTSPHAPVFSDYIYMSFKDKLAGDLGNFGSPGVRLEFDNNLELAEMIRDAAAKTGIHSGGIDDSIARQYRLSTKLDHGALVPLYYVDKAFKGFKLVHIAISGLPFIDLYRFGMCIKEAVAAGNENVVFLASGDLSHRLSEDAPYGFNKKGRVFDELLIDSVKESDVEKLLGLTEDFCEEAGECGLRSFLMMYGALDGCKLKPEVYSYQGPFGVGYAVARIGVAAEDKERELLDRIRTKNKKELNDIRQTEDPYVRLARETLETYIKDKRIIKPVNNLPEDMLRQKAGVFVSIKKFGQLRGCIGTTAPTRSNVAEEIIYNAISSGTRDPRFEPVEEDELENLIYSVDVLDKPDPIASIEELDVIRYGVIVRSGDRSGLLLPNLEGVDTPEKQVSIALQKAGIRQDESYRMERFEVVRHK